MVDQLPQQVNTPIMGGNGSPWEYDVSIKSDLVNPQKQASSKYQARLTRALRTAFINPKDMEYWQELGGATVALCNRLDWYKLPVPAEMLWTRFEVQLNMTASENGFQVRNLGTTTGSQHQTIEQRAPNDKR